MDPLFVPTLEDLKSRLRLSGVSLDDASAQIDTAIREARVGFYDHLDSSRVAEIVAIVRSETPATTDQITRERAELCEIAWVKMLLIQAMPVLFMDTAAQTRQAWNDEGLTRGLGRKEIDAMVADLWAKITGYLSELGDGEGDPSQIRVAVIGPDTPQPIPGASIAP